MHRFGTQVCGSLSAGGAREWLAPDGRGGYAMGTVCGLRTRRYHGLLVLSGDTPARRMMGLASLDPVLTLPGGGVVRLATHEWASGAIAPDGYALLESFELRDGLPTWRWRVGEIVLERTLTARPTLAVVDTLLAGGPVEVAVEPLCTWRDAHGERHAGDGLEVEPTGDGFVVEGHYRVVGPGFAGDTVWYHDFFHREEAARGLSATEDLLRVGRFAQVLHPGESLAVQAYPTTMAPPPPAQQVIDADRARNRAILTHGELALAADAFIVATPAGPDVVAGYPWFGTWSRDTMISYEGLFLTTPGRVEQGRALLLAYAATLSDGMLANTADTGSVEHNTADATLWFLHAAHRHIAVTGDDDLAATLVGPFGDIVRHHLDGTRYGLRIDPADALLTQGADGYALTWMDAVIGGVPVTPRRGKAVELNALWINGLAALAALRARVGKPADDLTGLRDRAVASFRRRFPAPTGWLYDTLDDASLRPNQLFAYSLPGGPMRGQDPTPVRAVRHALLTPLGVRTLASTDPAYRGRHRGSPVDRDLAYHQGTVWPWLIGAYVDAALAVEEPVDDLLDPLVAHLDEWGVGSVSETADGDPPHAATGCPFQAWSVAELTRALARLA